MKPITRKQLKQIARSSLSHALPFLMTLIAANVALANPTGGVVSSGTATISNSGNTTTINQSSQQATINWNSFNINSNQTTNFQQPTNGVALNRISSNQGASQIFGHLNATGEVILVNAAGFNFASGSVVNVGGIIASTANISDANFLAGNYVFDQASTIRGASVVNSGSITAANYGLVALLGPTVTNNGYIHANLGAVALGSGNTFTLDFTGDQLINFAVTSATSTGSGVTNSSHGSIQADGGQILVAAQVNVSPQGCQNVLDNAIDMQGVAQANSVSTQNGQIVLSTNQGAEVGGQLKAEGVATGTTGGSVQVYANSIQVDNNAMINANGDSGGGNITLAQMNSLGNLVNASSISTGNNSVISANVTGGSYDGAGNVNLYGNNISLEGTISANGTGSNSFGGTIGIYGNNISMQNAELDASAQFIGGTVNIGTNPLSATNTTSSSVNIDSNSDVTVSVSGQNSFAGSINIAANTVNMYGELDATGLALGSFGGELSITGVNLTIGQVSQNNNFGCGGGNGGGCGSPCGGCGGAQYASNGALLNASGNLFGGEILLGGNINAPLTTNSIVVNAGSTLSAISYATNNTNYPSGGYISLYATNDTVNGTLNVSAPTLNSGALAGEINIFATNNISVGSSAQLLAYGDAAGGEVLIGGDIHGAGVDPDAANVTIASGSLIDANALTNGNGGQVVVYSNGTTNFGGAITAEGGRYSGNGGEVEVAGATHTNIERGSSINVSAPHGTNGTVLNN